VPINESASHRRTDKYISQEEEDGLRKKLLPNIITPLSEWRELHPTRASLGDAIILASGAERCICDN